MKGNFILLGMFLLAAVLLMGEGDGGIQKNAEIKQKQAEKSYQRKLDDCSNLQTKDYILMNGMGPYQALEYWGWSEKYLSDRFAKDLMNRYNPDSRYLANEEVKVPIPPKKFRDPIVYTKRFPKK